MYNQEKPEMGFSHKIAEVFYGIKNVLSSRSALALAMGTIAILDIGLKVPPEDVSMIRGTHTEACDATPQIPKLAGLELWMPILQAIARTLNI